MRELPLSSHHAKFQINIFNFDPQMAVIYVKSDDVIFFNRNFWTFLDVVHKNKIHLWNPGTKLNKKHVSFNYFILFQNLT